MRLPKIDDQGFRRIVGRKRKPTSIELDRQEKETAVAEAISAGRLVEYLEELAEDGHFNFYDWWWDLELELEVYNPDDPEWEGEVVYIAVNGENAPSYEELISGEWEELNGPVTESSAAEAIQQMEEESIRADQAQEEAYEQAGYAIKAAQSGDWGKALNAANLSVRAETDFGVSEAGYHPFFDAIEIAANLMGDA
jgi:hypothetical protein